MNSLAGSPRVSLGLALVTGALCATSISCITEDPALTKSQFATVAAEEICNWGFACCDDAERGDQLANAGSRASCVAQTSTRYADLYRDANDEQWNSAAAASCVDQIRQAADSCPRAFSAAATIAECNLVSATKKPGDLCDNTWECTTQFCKNGVCANPLPEDSACTDLEPCAAGLRCISGTCRSLQVDGAACTLGGECISGACGGGKCVVSATFTCDGPSQ